MPDLRIPAAFGLSSRTRWLQGLTVREAVRSAVLSARHHAWHEGRPLIVASPGSAIECHPTAKLDLGGPLSLGHWPTGPPSALPALVQLGADSVLKVRGWAVFAGGSVVVVGPGAVLDLAGCDDGSEGVIVSTGARIVCLDHVSIGAGSALAWESQILDTDHHHIVTVREPRFQTYNAAVEIGKRVLIGSRASVLKGVTIGDDSVIGSGAVVTASVPPNTLVVGNPAQVVREGIRWY